MVHNLIDLIVAGVTGYCKIHGTSSHQCGAAKEFGGLAVVSLVGLGILGALKE